jgi:hypothetical protein
MTKTRRLVLALVASGLTALGVVVSCSESPETVATTPASPAKVGALMGGNPASNLIPPAPDGATYVWASVPDAGVPVQGFVLASSIAAEAGSLDAAGMFVTINGSDAGKLPTLTAVVDAAGMFVTLNGSDAGQLPTLTSPAGALTAFAGDLLGSAASIQWVESLSGLEGGGGAIPLTNGAGITAQVDSGAYIDLHNAYYGSGVITANSIAVHPNPHSFGIAPIDIDALDAGTLSIGTGYANSISVGSAYATTTFGGACLVTPTSTAKATGAASQFGSQGSTAATGTGGTTLIYGGTATGGTSGSPGPVILQRLTATGTGTEPGIIFERGSTQDFLFINSQPIFAAAGYTLMYFGANAASPSTTNYSLRGLTAGGGFAVNDASEVSIFAGGYTAFDSTASAVTIGQSGSGIPLLVNGPALTTSQSTGTAGLSTLSASAVYSFLPVTINGVAVQLVVTH